MKTKFVLHGGFNKEKGPVQENDEFFQEMLRDAPGNAKLLLVYFAEREEMVQLRIEQDKEQFDKNRGERNINFRVASEASFLEDCKWADVIYLHGGRTVKLMEILKRYQDLEQAFKGKTVAGDSAGANALGQLFYSKNSKEIGERLKILPFKVVVHYTDGTPNPLVNIQPDIETIILHEYETKVFRK